MKELGTALGAQLREAYRLSGSPPQLGIGGDLLPVVNGITLDESPWHGKLGFSSAFGIGAAVGLRTNVQFGLQGTAPPESRIVVRRITVVPNGAGSFWSLSASNVVDVTGNVLTAILPYDWDQSPDANAARRSPVTWQYGNTGAAAFTTQFHIGYTPNLGTGELLGPFIFGPGQNIMIQLTSPNVEAYISIYADIYGL